MNIRKQTKIWQAAIGCMSLALMQLNSAAVNAADFPLVDIAGEAAGTEIITAGKGLEGAKSVDINVINFTVPASNTIKQILLFWEGYTNVDQGIPTPGDSDIMVNGDPVSGDLLGGPVILGNSGELASYAYRADITNKVTPSAGAKAVAISALEFDLNNDGAGVMVILDDGTDQAEIAIREGNDFAYWKATGDLQVTGAQVFNDFTPSSEARAANLELMFASVEGGFSGGGERPSAIDVTIMGTTTEYNDLLNSVDGDEWDAITLPVTIPANASSLTVQAFSEDRAPVTGNDPASFHWLAAGLAITPTPPPVVMPGRMTGGGKIKDDEIWVKAAITIHCDKTLSNNIQINWKDQGNNKWHLTKPITDATCIDHPEISQAPPAAPLDTFIGEAVGKLNGQGGSILRFTFVDGGEPGKQVDSMAVSIWAPGDNPDNDEPVLEVSEQLKKGNYQAHYDQPHK